MTTIDTHLKTEIYYAVSDFLEAYKAKNFSKLADIYHISGDFLEEIYEMLDFVEDKKGLRLFPIEDMDKTERGKARLDIFLMDKEESQEGDIFGVECDLFEDKNPIGIIVGRYHGEDILPKFDFRYFSV